MKLKQLLANIRSGDVSLASGGVVLDDRPSGGYSELVDGRSERLLQRGDHPHAARKRPLLSARVTQVRANPPSTRAAPDRQARPDVSPRTGLSGHGSSERIMVSLVVKVRSSMALGLLTKLAGHHSTDLTSVKPAASSTCVPVPTGINTGQFDRLVGVEFRCKRMMGERRPGNQEQRKTSHESDHAPSHRVTSARDSP